MTIEEFIISPFELKKKWPLRLQQQKFIHDSREIIANILKGQDPRLLLIIGPCSIQSKNAALSFAKKLKVLSDKFSSQFFIVMRTFFEKPRTSSGWKGFLYDPHLNEEYDMNFGLEESRQILSELASLELPAGTEFLNPATPHYLSDLISWGCIGARTSESQTHREIASLLPCPVSFKNSTSGSIDVAINGMLSASSSQCMVGINQKGELVKITSKGNAHTHLTLRGSDSYPNFDPESIAKALQLLKNNNLQERLLIDCSHGNSNRQMMQQPVVFQSVIHQMIEGNSNIKGLILESEQKKGNQPIPKDLSQLELGVSVTDPCIDLEMTECLLAWAFEKMEKQVGVQTF